jgi:hypothetical protein
MSEQQFNTPHPIRLDATIAAGSIQITTDDGDESTVTLDGPPKLLDVMRVELVGDRLVIAPRRKSFTGWFGRLEQELDVQVRIPRASTVEFVTASADATLEGTFAGLEVKSASGGVVFTGSLEGDARVQTVSGDVRLPGVAGDVTASSVSGDISAEAVGGSVIAKSVSGDVRVGSLREGSVNVQSVSGDVELGIASGTSVDVDAKTASGDLTSEVPLSATPGSDPGPTVVIRGNTVSGDFHVVRAA